MDEELTDVSQPFDLIVVGAGAAGLAAASRAVDLGGRVLTLRLGGESNRTVTPSSRVWSSRGTSRRSRTYEQPA